MLGYIAILMLFHVVTSESPYESSQDTENLKLFDTKLDPEKLKHFRHLKGQQYANYLLSRLKHKHVQPKNIKKFLDVKHNYGYYDEDPDFQENRRLFGWINNIFGKAETKESKYFTTTPVPTTRTTTEYYPTTRFTYSTRLTTPVDDNRLNDRDITRELINTIEKLTEAVYDLNWSLNTKLIRRPISYDKRVKRDIGNELSNDTVNSDANDTVQNIEAPIDTNQTEDTTDDLPSRRSYHNFNKINNNVLRYIDDSYNDFLKKFQPVVNTKEMFKDDISFKVGYLIANSDNLNLNLANIITDLQNQNHPDEETVIQALDSLLLANRVIAEVMDVLKGYLYKNQPYFDLNRDIANQLYDNRDDEWARNRNPF